MSETLDYLPRQHLGGHAYLGVAFQDGHQEDVVINRYDCKRIDDIVRFKRLQKLIPLLEDTGANGLVPVQDMLPTHPFGSTYENWVVSTHVPVLDLFKTMSQRRSPFPSNEISTIITGITNILTPVHEIGIIHRDLKPENILYGLEKVWLIDFDAATHPSTEHISPTSFFGTARYSAPEIYGTQGTPASDVYSLGVIAYELAKGEFLFEHTEPTERIQQSHRSGAVSRRLMQETLPEKIKKTLRRAIRRKPRKRHPTAKEFAEELSDAVLAIPCH